MRTPVSRQFCFIARTKREEFPIIMWNDGGGYQSMNSSFGQGKFGGGGYMQDNPGFSSPATESQEKKKGGSSRTQSVLPCTIKQLKEASYSQAMDLFSIGTIELNQVTIVGVIREAQESATNITYKINDMTGEDIIVRKWIDNEENEMEKEKRSACRENTYVRVVGHMKSFQESRSIVAFNLMSVTDLNEITYHMLDVIHSHLVLSKQPELTAYEGDGRPGQGSMMTPSKMETSFGKGGGAGASLGLSGHQQQVHDIIASCQTEQGMGINELRQKLRGIPETHLRGAIEFLSNEGHIYSTVDDEHFKSTDSGYN